MLSKEFEVIEVTKKVPPQYLIIEPTKLRQTKGIVEALEFAPYVQYLLDSKHGRLAIRAAAEKDAHSIRFAKKGKETKATTILCQNAKLVGLIRSCMPEWKDDVRYIIRGKYSKSDKAVIFDLHDAEIYGGRKRRTANSGEPEDDDTGIEFEDPDETLVEE